MLYLLNISGAFIVTDFQLPFVLKVFPTSHSLILLIPIFNIKHEIYKINHNYLYTCNSVTGALKPTLKRALLFYNATPPQTDFPD